MAVNLLRDDFEAVAEHVCEQIHQCSVPKVVTVQRNGRVGVTRQRCYHGPDEPVVGVYTRAARIEFLETDLLYRLREIRA